MFLDTLKDSWDLNEEKSKAAEEAKRMGLEDLSFGRWGRDGQVTHKTVGDHLLPIHEKMTPEKVMKALKAKFPKGEETVNGQEHTLLIKGIHGKEAILRELRKSGARVVPRKMSSQTLLRVSEPSHVGPLVISNTVSILINWGDFKDDLASRSVFGREPTSAKIQLWYETLE